MADFEATLACFYLNNEKNYAIIPVGENKEPKTAHSGLIYLPSYSINEISNLDDIAGIIFPGGYNITCSPSLIDLIKTLDNQGKLIAAICAGPTHLALAGILDGRK